MAELFANGHIVDVVLVFMAVELIVVILVLKKIRHGWQPFAFFISLAAGFCLLMALRAALLGAAWHSIAVWLVASLVAHLWDLRLRWAAP